MTPSPNLTNSTASALVSSRERARPAREILGRARTRSSEQSTDPVPCRERNSMTDGAAPVALVTGAGTGIGRATAIRLAQDGHALALAGRRAAPLEAVRDDIRSQGGAATAVTGDVSTPEGAEQAVSLTLAAYRRLDVLVCNHGVGDSQPVGDETPEGWERTMRINLTGPFLLARAALSHLLQRQGSMVTVASINGWLAGQAGPLTAPRRRG